MHMSDALVSPAVGGTLWAVSGLTLYLSGKNASREGGGGSDSGGGDWGDSGGGDSGGDFGGGGDF